MLGGIKFDIKLLCSYNAQKSIKLCSMNTNNLKQLLIDQKEELKSSLINQKIIQRECFKNYQKLLKSSLIKIITGPRRAGKSVLAYQLLLQDKNFAYVNFDDERLATLKTGDLNLVLESIYILYQKPKFIFLDEIQNIQNWELFVNRLKRLNFNLIITGSNAKLLSSELSTHLTGRHISLELYPFSFREYLIFQGFDYQQKTFSTKEVAFIKKALAGYLAQGGFPEIVQGEPMKRYLISLYSAILTKDILLRHKIKYINTFKELANYLITNFARLITFNKLKNIFALNSVHTAKNYFSFLEETYLIFYLEKFSYKTKQRLTAPRKIYAIDAGLINALSSASSPNLGLLYENIVAIELLRRKALNPEKEIYYWQDNHKGEVDFVIKQGLKIEQLIQVCYDMQNYDTKKREISSLLRISQETKCNNLLIINDDYHAEEKIKQKKIKFIPLWQWLLNPLDTS